MIKLFFWKLKKSKSLVIVDGGQRAVIFDRFTGVKPNIIGEGTHMIIPVIQKPIIFDIRSTPRVVSTITGSKGRMFSRNSKMD